MVLRSVGRSVLLCCVILVEGDYEGDDDDERFAQVGELREYHVVSYGEVRFSAPVAFRGIRSAVCWGFGGGVSLFSSSLPWKYR
jgi:hypothetical protein